MKGHNAVSSVITLVPWRDEVVGLRAEGQARERLTRTTKTGGAEQLQKGENGLLVPGSRSCRPQETAKGAQMCGHG